MIRYVNRRIKNW
jgi:hypothetical protein